MECKFCKKEVIQPEGKRKKEFCSDTCRSNFWYAKNKKGKKTEVSLIVPEGNKAKKTTSPKITFYASNDKKDGQIPPMPIRGEKEDAIDFAARKNDWKRLYGK